MSGSTNPASASSSGPAECCVDPGKGTAAQYTTPYPSGKDIDIAGVKAYSVGEGNAAAVLLVTDVFGHQFPAHRANADIIAAGGFHVIVPDLFNGDAVPGTKTQEPGGWDWIRGTWWPLHTAEKTAEVAVAVGKELKTRDSIKTIAAIGFCYGAVGVLRLFQEDLVSCGVVCHPTGFTKDGVSLVDRPLLFNCAESDDVFTPELRQHWETKLKERGAPVKFITYPGVQHGFVARLDGTANGLAQRQSALNESIAFMKQRAAA